MKIACAKQDLNKQTSDKTSNKFIYYIRESLKI